MYPPPSLLISVLLLHHPQVKQRADECILALDKLIEINSGRPVQNVLQTQFDWLLLKVMCPHLVLDEVMKLFLYMYAMIQNYMH